MNRDRMHTLALGLVEENRGANNAQQREAILRVLDTVAISARAAALEEAAKVAESASWSIDLATPDAEPGPNQIIASSIRSLIKEGR